MNEMRGWKKFAIMVLSQLIIIIFKLNEWVPDVVSEFNVVDDDVLVVTTVVVCVVGSISIDVDDTKFQYVGLK